ncbi:RluA family pseudouridine synthase [Lactobacillus sp. LC28-10]|uniref:Pseudouridine synthase n=1 Tax=Secundilactobacillus angelensis TaxID=2722706 RepID=A0ABX1KXK0_9LACO|nr:RluA family pseudouridine synthase [Secundilactobacillus angelensis]MCH5462947.1 RluA family pseudouridine synthase [Secundilactobacillus angelensis]NLR18672.1 RluA family pseudouridine synthase [Secundilactobacillus angelensis]
MAQATEWRFTTRLPQNFHPKSLRQLLMADWYLPKHLVFSLKRGERVLVNGQYLPVNFDVHPGDQIMLKFLATDFEHPYSNVTPDSAATVSVLYEDANLLVVNKTQGSKTHPNQPGEVGTTLNHVAAYLASKDQQPYVINRLDQETSGALLIAKNPAVVPVLVRLVKEKLIKRTYLTWVHGRLNSTQGIIAMPIGLNVTDKRKRQVNGEHPQMAITRFKVMDRNPDATLVAVHLQTGRTHQIRVHFASLGHPIVGDPLYANDPRQQRLLLHSWQLRLPLPFSFKHVMLTASLPETFHRFEQRYFN